MREVYRKNQHFFQELFAQNRFGVHAVFIANKDGLTYQEVAEDMIPLLKQAGKRLAKMTNRNYPADTAPNTET